LKAKKLVKEAKEAKEKSTKAKLEAEKARK